MSKYFAEKEPGTPGRPPNEHRPIVNGINTDLRSVGIARSGALWRNIPNIPSRETNKVRRECDWWEYKKFAKTFFGFVYLVSIFVLLK